MYNYKKYYDRIISGDPEGIVYLTPTSKKYAVICTDEQLFISNGFNSDRVYLADGKWTYDGISFDVSKLPAYIHQALDKIARVFWNGNIFGDYIRNWRKEQTTDLTLGPLLEFSQDVTEKMKAIIEWLDYQDYELTCMIKTVAQAEALYDLFYTRQTLEFADAVWFGNTDEDDKEEAKYLKSRMAEILSQK